MARQWEYQLPTRVQFGRGGVKKLGEVAREFGTSALLVGYQDQTGLETVYARARKTLTEAGLAVVSFDQVPPDPNAELGAEGARLAAEAGVDVVVGLGGGSVIDAAKGIAAVVQMGGSLWDYTGANPKCRPVTESLPLVAVPTTAGTGTEVSGVAVFTHHGVGSDPGVPVKASISGPAVRPNVALVDPDLAVGSPASLTAACGGRRLGARHRGRHEPSGEPHLLDACRSCRPPDRGESGQSG